MVQRGTSEECGWGTGHGVYGVRGGGCAGIRGVRFVGTLLSGHFYIIIEKLRILP